MKRAVTVFAVLFTLILLYTIAAIPLSAESLYIRKIVSVVYDDSGSMSYNDSLNWAYANYAMQSFCGLLNNDDQLYVTYMSESESNNHVEPERIDLDAKSIQESVDGIRNHYGSRNTPYGAIDIAFNKLKSVQDSNANTQYWLVVITDGEFQNGEYKVPLSNLDKKLNDYVAETMPNGSTPKISYLAIGESAPKPTADENNDIYVYESAGADDIVSVMSRIADRVSGRSRLSGSDIAKVSSDTIEISTAVPLLNIAILSQNSAAKIVSAGTADKTLNVQKSAAISYPEVDGFKTDTSLNGGVFLLNDPDGNIEEGTYQIKFSEGIDVNDIVVMFEPALEIRMTAWVNGQQCGSMTDLKKAREKDEVKVLCKIYEIGTDKEISPSLLPDDTAYSISVAENGNTVMSDNSGTMQIDGYTLKNTPTEITASVSLKGFNPIVLSTGEFTPDKAIVYSLEVSAPDNFSMSMAQLRENTDKIIFTIYADGEPVSKEQAEKLPFDIKTEMPGNVLYEDDGRISFTPTYREPVTSIPTGDVEITGTLENVGSKTATLYIKPLEYSIKCVSPDDQKLIRSGMKDNTVGVEFEAYVDGERLDKQALEAADVTCDIIEPYSKKLRLITEITDDGKIKAVPVYDKWEWLTAYLLPTGTVSIEADFEGASAVGKLSLGKDLAHEIIFNYAIPAAVIILIIGEIFKKRFKYSYKIHYNHGEGAGSFISGPINGWNTVSLFTVKAFIPFIPDTKRVNGAKFYAKGIAGNTSVIGIKPPQYPEYSGIADGGLDPMEAVRLRKLDISAFEPGEKKRDLIPGNALVVSSDRNYGSCQLYLYSDN